MSRLTHWSARGISSFIVGATALQLLLPSPATAVILALLILVVLPALSLALAWSERRRFLRWRTWAVLLPATVGSAMLVGSPLGHWAWGAPGMILLQLAVVGVTLIVVGALVAVQRWDLGVPLFALGLLGQVALFAVTWGSASPPTDPAEVTRALLTLSQRWGPVGLLFPASVACLMIALINTMLYLRRELSGEHPPMLDAAPAQSPDLPPS